MNTKPFMFQFAKPCCSPGRQTNDGFFYDESVDMVRSVTDGQPLAIEVNASGGPRTKKNDIEKGEDNKDRRMWQ